MIHGTEARLFVFYRVPLVVLPLFWNLVKIAIISVSSYCDSRKRRTSVSECRAETLNSRDLRFPLLFFFHFSRLYGFSRGFAGLLALQRTEQQTNAKSKSSGVLLHFLLGLVRAVSGFYCFCRSETRCQSVARPCKCTSILSSCLRKSYVH